MLDPLVSREIAAFCSHPYPIRLTCGVQHYDWGDAEAIPEILEQANPRHQPFAELWAGAHPDLPATAVLGQARVALDVLIAQAPEAVLGPRLAQRFDNKFPFLLKIIAARRPLSIQAHPDDVQARAGFERENRAGLPLEASRRNYRDPRPKPELLVALTDFYSLRGFRPLEEIARLLAETPELAPLQAAFQAHGGRLAPFYAHLLHLSPDQTDALLSPLLERLRREPRKSTRTPAQRVYWLLRADREYSTPEHRDPGLFSILLLNLVALRPRQGLFLPAGALHAYLQGVGIELMGNSNNVLRGGLTHKFVDVDELLRTLSFRAAPVTGLEGVPQPNAPGLLRYPTSASEFSLTRLESPAGRTTSWEDGELRLLLVTSGALEAGSPERTPLTLRGGGALLAPAGVRWTLRAVRDSVCWIARVPPEAPDREPD